MHANNHREGTRIEVSNERDGGKPIIRNVALHGKSKEEFVLFLITTKNNIFMTSGERKEYKQLLDESVDIPSFPDPTKGAIRDENSTDAIRKGWPLLAGKVLCQFSNLLGLYRTLSLFISLGAILRRPIGAKKAGYISKERAITEILHGPRRGYPWWR